MLEDNPYGLLRYEGEPLPTLYSLDDEFVIYAEHVLEDPLARACGSDGLSRRPPILAEDADRQAGLGSLLVAISQYFVSAYFESGPWAEYVHSLLEIYRRRRDVMLDALAEHFPREAEWTDPQGGLFIWRRCPTT